MTDKKTRGRPQVADSVELAVGAEKVRVTLTIDGRIQVSMPGTWAVSGLTGAQGRKRLDVVPMNGSAAGIKKAAETALANKQADPTKSPAKKATAKVSEKAITPKADIPKRKPGRPRKVQAESAVAVAETATPAPTARKRRSAKPSNAAAPVEKNASAPRRRRSVKRGVEFSSN